MAARNVLIVAYHYPPIRSAGVERTVKFERYLPECGYRTTILTTATFGGGTDQRLVRAWEPLAAYRWLFNRQARSRREGSTQVRTAGGASGKATGDLIKRWLLIPDGQITWAPAAIARGLRLLRREPIDLIYSTSPPASAHLIALMLANLTGVPWVADFRDSWIYDPLDLSLSGEPSRFELESWLESAVVNAADETIAATAISADMLRLRHPAAGDHISVITNGFDPDDLDDAVDGPLPERLLFDTETPIEQSAQQVGGQRSDEGEEGPMRVVHTGSFSQSHPSRSPQGLFEALRQLVAEDEAWSKRLQVTLVGRLTSHELSWAADLIENGIVQIAGEVDAATARRFQRNANLLLVVDHDRAWPASNVPGKFYDYLGAGHPILALCGAGALSSLVEELGGGVWVKPDAAAGIALVLAELHEQFAAGTLGGAHGNERIPGNRGGSDLRRFNRRQLSGQLAACFDRALERRQRPFAKAR